MKLDDAIDERRSIRKFSPKRVRWDSILEAIDAANKAPYAGNINNLKFLIVEDQDSINILAECAQQDWMADATFIVVVCADYAPLESMYHDYASIYSRQQVGAAIENFFLKITDLKLGSCWVGAFTEEHIKRELKIPKDIVIEALLPVGYPNIRAKKKQSKKFPLARIIYWGEWKKKKKPTKFKEPKTW